MRGMGERGDPNAFQVAKITQPKTQYFQHLAHKSIHHRQTEWSKLGCQWKKKNRSWVFFFLKVEPYEITSEQISIFMFLVFYIRLQKKKKVVIIFEDFLCL